MCLKAASPQSPGGLFIPRSLGLIQRTQSFIYMVVTPTTPVKKKSIISKCSVLKQLHFRSQCDVSNEKCQTKTKFQPHQITLNKAEVQIKLAELWSGTEVSKRKAFCGDKYTSSVCLAAAKVLWYWKNTVQ